MKHLDAVYETFGKEMCLCPFFGAFYQTNEVVSKDTETTPNSVRPCSLIASEWGAWNIDNDSIQKSRNSDKWKDIRKQFLDGNFQNIPDCRVCTMTESFGGSSPRTGANYYFAEHSDVDFVSEINRCIANDHEMQDLVVMDYYPSNYCNYACIMCAGGASSKRYTFEIKNGNAGRKIVTNEPNSDFLEALETVQILNFTGGETILQSQVLSLIDYLVESGLSTNMTISLLTNASSYPEQLEEKFKKFKKVIYTVSVDGTGSIIEYQRRNARWETVSENALRIMNNPDLSGTINYVVTAVTIMKSMDFIDWLYEHNLAWFTISPVFRVEHLGLTALPQDLRNIAQQRLRIGLEKYKSLSDPLHNAIQTLIDMINRAEFNHNDLNKFIEHINLEDQASELKLIDIIPEWAPYFQSNQV